VTAKHQASALKASCVIALYKCTITYLLLTPSGQMSFSQSSVRYCSVEDATLKGAICC